MCSGRSLDLGRSLEASPNRSIESLCPGLSRYGPENGVVKNRGGSGLTDPRIRRPLATGEGGEPVMDDLCGGAGVFRQDGEVVAWHLDERMRLLPRRSPVTAAWR